MTNINGVSSYNYNQENIKTNYDKNDIKLEDISILYTTKKKEDDRTTFEETFKNVFANESEQGQGFLNGLIDNKQDLMDKLNLTDDQYDSLACTALALASQETGMGEEKGYNGENTFPGNLIRSVMKGIDVLRGGVSASSGLTQMKIYDFLNDPSKLSEEQRDILKEYGITADGIAKNNLYDNPDKAAVATMVVLKSITEKYDYYKNDVLSKSHDNISQKLGLNTDTDKETALQKGNEILSKISDIYSNAGDDNKMKIRNALKECFIAYDETKIGDKIAPDGSDLSDKYNEEVQINELNQLLGGKFNLSATDLDYIRYSLTDSNSEMSMTEFCAFGWNKGTDDNSLKLDRLLADKIGTILANPEDFDYDQFTVNVATLAEKYASQSS